MELWGISRDAAIEEGIWRYQFARQSVALSSKDTLVAAAAKEQHAIVVTNIICDYPMAGVQLLPGRCPLAPIPASSPTTESAAEK
jgi:hypothetical protein